MKLAHGTIIKKSGMRLGLSLGPPFNSDCYHCKLFLFQMLMNVNFLPYGSRDVDVTRTASTPQDPLSVVATLDTLLSRVMVVKVIITPPPIKKNQQNKTGKLGRFVVCVDMNNFLDKMIIQKQK